MPKPIILFEQSGTQAARALLSGELGDGVVVSGNIASGQIGTNHLASGVIPASSDFAKVLREPDNIISAEPISGGFTVALNTSGRGVVALAADSTRMPAIGVEASGAASGVALTVNLDGRTFSANFNNGAGFSGSLGKAVFVSTSGFLTATPPSASGQFQQRVGSVFIASGVILRWEPETVQILS